MIDDLNIELDPLTDRIINHFGDYHGFTVKQVIEYFPTVPKSTIYKAIQDLIREGRLVEKAQIGRYKTYSTMGHGVLPHFKTSDGTYHPVSVLAKTIEDLYSTAKLDNPDKLDSPDKLDGKESAATAIWRPLVGSEVNNIPMLIGQLFIIAKMDDKQTAKRMLQGTVQKLITAKRTLNLIEGYIDVVLNNPSVANCRVEDVAKIYGKDDDPYALTDEERIALIRFMNSLVKKEEDK